MGNPAKIKLLQGKPMGSYLNVKQRSSSSITPQWHPDLTQAAAPLRPWHWSLVAAEALEATNQHFSDLGLVSGALDTEGRT